MKKETKQKLLEIRSLIATHPILKTNIDVELKKCGIEPLKFKRAEKEDTANFMLCAGIVVGYCDMLSTLELNDDFVVEEVVPKLYQLVHLLRYCANLNLAHAYIGPMCSMLDSYLERDGEMRKRVILSTINDAIECVLEKNKE
jgi:hypothetical protein